MRNFAHKSLFIAQRLKDLEARNVALEKEAREKDAVIFDLRRTVDELHAERRDNLKLLNEKNERILVLTGNFSL